jgi:hypothetical protein
MIRTELRKKIGATLQKRNKLHMVNKQSNETRRAPLSPAFTMLNKGGKEDRSSIPKCVGIASNCSCWFEGEL